MKEVLKTIGAILLLGSIVIFGFRYGGNARTVEYKSIPVPTPHSFN